jgi:hypothetical protein
MKQRGGRGEPVGEPSPAIQVGVKAGPDAEEARWTALLTLYFRVLSLAWIVMGLEHWRRILAPDGGSFLDVSHSVMAATIFFAVLDLVAAVGLWLVAPWGGAVWLSTVLALMFVISTKPSFFVGGAALTYLLGALVALYLFLSWRANAASGEGGAMDRLLRALWARLRRASSPSS